MQRLGFTGLRRVLCIGAHPDDIEIGCGGSLLTLLDAHPELEVTWVVLSGDEARRDEAAQSAERLLAGAAESSVQLLDFRDAFLPFEGARVKSFFNSLKTSVSPDLIFTHRREDLHQDHRFVAELTWQTFRDHLILEYEIPKYEGDLGASNVFQPVTEETAQRKVEAIMRGFPSQKRRTWFSEDTFWALLRLRGVESNSPTRFAEAFQCRKVVL